MRGAVPSDLDAIGALVRRSMAHPWTLDQLASALASPGSRVQLALSEPPDARDASPIAFAFARRVTDLLEIDLVGAEPDHRRAGIARALLEHLIEAERAEGMRAVEMELAASNDAARALYEGLGFVVVGRRSRYYPDGDDTLMLTKTFE